MYMGQFGSERYTFAVRVTDHDGNPLNAGVQLWYKGGGGQTKVTGSDGIVDFNVPKSEAPAGVVDMDVAKTDFMKRRYSNVDVTKPVTHQAQLTRRTVTVPLDAPTKRPAPAPAPTPLPAGAALVGDDETDWGQIAIYGGIGIAAIFILPKLFGR